mmetsp:Transcript_10012/g.23563  ORF Transcript_10012/g.23563 Transcript_10012/m.23563 type:complete len:204 (-) Transcript_10012:381-992(-)
MPAAKVAVTADVSKASRLSKLRASRRPEAENAAKGSGAAGGGGGGAAAAGAAAWGGWMMPGSDLAKSAMSPIIFPVVASWPLRAASLSIRSPFFVSARVSSLWADARSRASAPASMAAACACADVCMDLAISPISVCASAPGTLWTSTSMSASVVLVAADCLLIHSVYILWSSVQSESASSRISWYSSSMWRSTLRHSFVSSL